MFHVMITNEEPVTILQAYFSVPQHIRKDMLIRWIITLDLCIQQLVTSNFAKNQENFEGEICLNVNTPFTIVVVVLSYVMLQKQKFE